METTSHPIWHPVGYHYRGPSKAPSESEGTTNGRTEAGHRQFISVVPYSFLIHPPSALPALLSVGTGLLCNKP